MTTDLDNVPDSETIRNDRTETKQPQRGISAITRAQRRVSERSVSLILEQSRNDRFVADIKIRIRVGIFSIRLLLLLSETVHRVQDSILSESFETRLCEFGVRFAGFSKSVDLDSGGGVGAEGFDECDGSTQHSTSAQRSIRDEERD